MAGWQWLGSRVLGGAKGNRGRAGWGVHRAVWPGLGSQANGLNNGLNNGLDNGLGNGLDNGLDKSVGLFAFRPLQPFAEGRLLRGVC